MATRLLQWPKARRLTVELLEGRNPASTALDLLLADLWLTAAGQDDVQTGSSGTEDPITTAIPQTEVFTLPPPRVQTADDATGDITDPVVPGAFQHVSYDLMLDAIEFLTAPTVLPSPADQSAVVGATPDAEVPPFAGIAQFIGGSSIDTDIPSLTDPTIEPLFFAATSPGPPPPPTIALAAESNYIPLNANNTNHSAWRKDANGNNLIGFPLIRDLAVNPMRDLSNWNGVGEPPGGAPIADPELKPMTASVVSSGRPEPIRITLTLTRPIGGGRVALWETQSKTRGIGLAGGIQGNGTAVYTGTLPNYPTSTFYVEGLNPSYTAGDVKIQVEHGGGVVSGPGGPVILPVVQAERVITITPVINSFVAEPKTPPQTTLVRNAEGSIIALTSGKQDADGADPGSGAKGVTFRADLNKTSLSGEGKLIQNVVSVGNGMPAGIEHKDGTRLNLLLKAIPGANPTQYYQYPILDTWGDDLPIFYKRFDIIGPDGDQHKFYTFDTPTFGNVAWPDKIKTMDLNFRARMHLLWKYPDATLYNLAYIDWGTVFRASTPAGGALTIGADSITTASTLVYSHADPAAIGTTEDAIPENQRPPVFNKSFEYR